MKKFRYVRHLLMVYLLLFGFVGQSFAAERDARHSNPDRATLNLEFNDSGEAPWAIEPIGKMKSKQVLSGYEDGSFRPNQPVSRVEAVVTAVRLMGLEQEAKAKPAGSKLHFKDAALIDNKYSWAKGYIIAALEQGLFDISEEQLQPDQPASRVWVAGLLVKALGLEQEALGRMTAAPDFKDAGDIPAGAVGYVNVAVERGIVSGYPDDTFKPNQNVTRAEMAALLVRTNDNLLEQSGAVVVTGKITAIDFTNRPVTDSVYADTYGSITIQSFNNDSLTYKIFPDLGVPFHQRFIPASQLLVGDAVSLTVERDVVLEASFIQEELIKETTAGINEFELEVELHTGQKMELKYKNDDGNLKAEITKQSKDDKGKEKVKGTEAVQAAEDFLKSAAITPQMTKQAIVNQILKTIEVENSQVKELDVEVKFANGTKIEIELENEEKESGSKQSDNKQPDTQANPYGVVKFKVDVELHNKQKLKVDYKHEDGKTDAKVEKDQEKASGEQAILAVEDFLKQLNLTDAMDKSDIQKRMVTLLQAKESDVKEFKCEIEFTSGKKVKIELENEKDDD